MQQLKLHEQVDNWAEELTVDVDQHLVRNVALAGPLSKNGYRYTEEALTSAAPLYESRPVFLDHASHPQRPLDRSTRDLVGSVVNARYVQGRIRGDISVLSTDSGETFLKLVEAETPGVGMSHVVLAQRSADGKAVEKIVEVVSVDVVVNPATTSTFRESTSTEVTNTDFTLRLAQMEQERNDLLTEVKQLQQQLHGYQQQDVIQQLVKESGLPVDAISACFRDQLLQAPSLGARRVLLEDRKHLLAEATRSSPIISLERSSPPGRGSVNDEFLKVFRRRKS